MENTLSEPEFVVDTKRHLPHKQLTDCVLFITWRLAFTLPESVLQKIAMNKSNYLNSIKDFTPQEKKNAGEDYKNSQFEYFDDWIDKFNGGKHNISLEPYLSIITDTIKHDESKKYTVSAYCIMPNHAHLIIKPLYKSENIYYAISEITEFLKSISAHKLNKALSLKGQLWQHESYDRVIRDEDEYKKTVEYVLMNPVKAGLVDKWEAWNGNYLCKELR
jgi:putative transposase